MKMISWNVNGLRALKRKGQFDFLKKTSADLIALQETKIDLLEHPNILDEFVGYQTFFETAKNRKGYSGVLILTKQKPINVLYGLGKGHLDQEGRLVVLYFPDFVFLNCYFPNGGGAPERLAYKLEYYREFLNLLKKIKKEYKKIVFCGDVNVAHQPIDLARPKENEKNIGFLPEERVWVDNFLKEGFVDTFRFLHPKEVDAYTWWDMKTRSRERNVGWRIDYFFISEFLKNDLISAKIHSKIEGSDHCPISVELK